MGAIEAIVVLALVGFLLLAAEVFVPGLVLGILGIVCLTAAVLVGYFQYGILAGTLIFAGLFVVVLAGFVTWMKAFPHTAIGRRIMLQKSLVSGDGRETARTSLAGKEGEALTPLRPAGTARLDGRKVDVMAESEFIAAGEPVIVVRDEGMRIVVRKKVQSPA